MGAKYLRPGSVDLCFYLERKEVLNFSVNSDLLWLVF